MLGLIVAYSNNRVIGDKGRIPWHIEGEQRRFRELTTGNVVIMGRRTFEEIGRALPNRTTIVVSTSMKAEDYSDVYVTDSFDAALELAETLVCDDNSKPDIYIAGGVSLYREAIEVVDVMYITEVDIDIEGDTVFPEFDESKFKKIIEEYHNGDIPYTYVTYISTGCPRDF